MPHSAPSVTETVTQDRPWQTLCYELMNVRGPSLVAVGALFCPLLIVAGGGCGSEAGATPPRSLELVSITDIDPSPETVEVNLIAGAGQTRYLADGVAEIWGYKDGARADARVMVPGPLIEVNEGDTVIVHFTNQLPEATTIHWHGVRVPNGADGTLSTQAEVPAGGSFDYRFTAVDAGTFWYHPHMRGDVQVERGLYGVVVVRGGPEIPVAADRTFVLDDVKLEATGKLSEKVESLDLMLGRQGNVILANGRPGGRIEVAGGARERWRFVNSANGRYFNLRLPGHAFTVIGWDGGILPVPYVADTLLIAPGERYEVLVDLAGAPGETLALETIHYDRGHDIPDPGPKPVFQIHFAGETTPAGPLPEVWGSFGDVPIGPATLTRSIVLAEEEATGPGAEPRFLINGTAFPEVPPIAGLSDAVETWSVRNDSEMDHPFHLHGMFFQVLDVDGIAPAHRGWKDTVNVPRKGTLRFAVRHGAAGRWMYHCHILEHAERGMMGELVLSN